MHRQPLKGHKRISLGEFSRAHMAFSVFFAYIGADHDLHELQEPPERGVLLFGV